MSLTLRTRFPCCGGGANIHADTGIARYERTCPRCGKQWLVVRREVSDEARSRINARAEILDWIPAPKPQTLF